MMMSLRGWILCPFSDGQPNRWLTGSRYLSFACPKKRYQRKRHPETCRDFQSQYPHIKKKTGTRELARCSALDRAQTNARYDPVLFLLFSCV